MKINALLMDETDNVVTCVAEVQPGEEVAWRRGGEVLKYGELIGRTSAAIGKGCWVADHNIYSVPRDYDSEMV